MFECKSTELPGVLTLDPRVARDSRGHFVKVFHTDAFRALGLPEPFAEIYYSSSRRNVVRGIHFQTPPHQHDKLVYCVSGRVLDVVVDLRRGSPGFGEAIALELDSETGRGVFIPAGCGHGFATLSEDAILIYFVTSVYAPEHDKGVRWDSISVPWPVARPFVSERDKSFPALGDFVSPFLPEQEIRSDKNGVKD